MRPFRHCLAADEEPAAQILAAAFHDDPVFGWIYPDEAGRVRDLPEWMELAVRAGRTRGHTYIAHDHGAVTVWSPPDVSLQDPDGESELGALLVRHLGPGGAARLAGASGLGEMHPDEPHFYLRFVGVHPSRQGQGLGRSMLEPILEICDAESVLAYLENSNPRNESFYRSLGFAQIDRFEIPDGPVLQAMQRAPGAGRG